MRDIKFRAWDKRFNQMQTLLLTDRLVSEALIVDGTTNTLMRNEDLSEWMQYTGLKDKNGVEIYEGDIVSLNGYQSTIEWCDSAWKLVKASGEIHCPLGEWDDYWGGEDETKLEVIGNIYENKELLK